MKELTQQLSCTKHCEPTASGCWHEAYIGVQINTDMRCSFSLRVFSSLQDSTSVHGLRVFWNKTSCHLRNIGSYYALISSHGHTSWGQSDPMNPGNEESWSKLQRKPNLISPMLLWYLP